MNTQVVWRWGILVALGAVAGGCGVGEEVSETSGVGEVQTKTQGLSGWTVFTQLNNPNFTLSARSWARSETLTAGNGQASFLDFSTPPHTVSPVPGTFTIGTGARLESVERQTLRPNPPGNVPLRHLEVFTRQWSKNGAGNVLMQEIAALYEFGGFAWWENWYQPFGTSFQILGSPAVSSTGSLDGDLDVFVTGTDNALWINSYVHTGAVTDPYSAPGHPDAWGQVLGFWTGFSPLNGTISSGTSPTAASYRYGVVALPERDVFVRNLSGSLSWRYWKSGFGWSSWQTPFPANTFVGSPVAVRSPFAANSVDVYVLGTDNNIYRNRMTVTNPDFLGPRTYVWSGYAFCGKPSGSTLTAENIGAAGSTLVVRDSMGFVFRATGDCP